MAYFTWPCGIGRTIRDKNQPPRGVGALRRGDSLQVRTGLGTVGALVLVGVLASCSSSAHQSDAGNTVQPNPPTTSATTSSAAPTTSAPAPLSTVATIQYAADGGYSWTATVASGPIRSVSDPSVNQSLVGACGADMATAGFIPLRITITSTTSQFSEDTAASFRLSKTDNNPEADFPYGVSWVGTFSDGPQCLDASTASGEPWTITQPQLAPGATATVLGGLVIANWKSPNHPSGDPAYSHMWMGQSNSSDFYDVQVKWMATAVSGPNVVDTGSIDASNSILSRWYFPVSGAD